ncbi:hypothetical protein [Chryseobacterium salviniae]|uniref:Uncharacterized protein n=1 Tax=Chryseobacterium salviniae TaxID=3101750 RepID=A0ABU6HQR6_9FLAO|nr:hypothetical protein [Chryseobacterium sp. T9W2-O]MEC3874207.1 hypothetical protein [Chryseobacterium sp. T9W2-O]
MEGWWSYDAQGSNRITEAKIDDTVYFNIITQKIPDIDPVTKISSEISIQLYDDDGGWGNDPDPISVREVMKDPITGKEIQGDLVTSKIVSGNRVSYSQGINPEDVKLNDVLAFILQHWSICNVYGEVHKIEFYVKGSQSNKMVKWWEERYQHLKIYSVWSWKGEQCTTAVKTALQEGGIYMPDETQKPSGILFDLKNVFSTSKDHFLEPSKEVIIKHESVDWQL